jgi:hypothetical protein
MFDDAFEAVEISGDDPDLAALFCEQLRVLGHPLPSHIAISELGDMVLCLMSWEPSPGFALSGVAAVSLRELAEAHLHRRVGDMMAESTPDFGGAVLHFFLEGSTEESGERAEAMRRWAGQASRVAAERRRVSISHRAEARNLRARSRVIRGEARRARGRHAAVV